jgi:hypothetical protein
MVFVRQYIQCSRTFSAVEGNGDVKADPVHQGVKPLVGRTRSAVAGREPLSLKKSEGKLEILVGETHQEAYPVEQPLLPNKARRQADCQYTPNG